MEKLWMDLFPNYLLKRYKYANRQPKTRQREIGKDGRPEKYPAKLYLEPLKIFGYLRNKYVVCDYQWPCHYGCRIISRRMANWNLRFV